MRGPDTAALRCPSSRKDLLSWTLLLGIFLSSLAPMAYAKGNEKPPFRSHTVPFQKPNPDAVVSPNLAGAAFKTETGIRIIGNTDGLHFLINVPGKEIKGANDGPNLLFDVDSIFFQVHTVPTKQFLGDAPFSDPSTILRMHRNWEVDYLRNGPQQVGEVFTEEIPLEKGSVVLFWSITVVPRGKTKVTDRLFVSRVEGKALLVLSSAVSGEAEYALAKKLLMASMTQTTFSEKRINPKEVQEKLKGNREERGSA